MVRNLSIFIIRQLRRQERRMGKLIQTVERVEGHQRAAAMTSEALSKEIDLIKREALSINSWMDFYALGIFKRHGEDD